VADQPTSNQPPADGDRPADETTVLPAAGGPTERPAPRWSARAGVPVGAPRREVPVEQQWVPEQPRTWWAPILIILAILVLVGLIGLGLWIAARNPSGTTPVASPTPSPTASSPSPLPSPSPSPTPSASPSEVQVPVPPLRGVSLTDAQQILQSQGLNWKVVTRPNDEVPVGSVIETKPPAGTLVPAGSEVTLYVATEVSPSSPAPPSD
jgi:hypothetical protein